MATFTNKTRKQYQNICHLSERGMLSFMRDLLTNLYGKESVIATHSYVMAIGEIPVALVAHADTVFKVPPSVDNFYYDQEKDVIWNPDGAGADDRAGIFAIVQIIRKTNLRPHIIITTGEECGCIGAGKLIGKVHTFPGDLRFMIQLDRRGHNDSVYYDLDNLDFEDFINAFGFKTAWGTFTDISILAPAWKVAAVNFSIGYEDEHHEIERLHVDWMYETIGKTVKILEHVRDNKDTVQRYEYKEIVGWHYGPYHSAWWDYDDDIPTPEGHAHCFMCNILEKKENMLPIWYPYGKQPYNMCMECYADVAHQIVWCKQCNRGIFLSAAEAKEIPDLNNWICEDCKNGKNTGTVQQSNSVQPGQAPAGNTHGPAIQPVAHSQGPVYQDDEWDDLRVGYADDL